MDVFDIDFFGWCNEGGHDKVWGWVTVGGQDGTLYNFWGRRGKKLSFKAYSGRFHGSTALQALAREKTRSRPSGTYREIAPQDIETVCPGFVESMHEQLVLAKLFGTIRGEE